MEKKVITVSLGASLPLLVLTGYICYNVGEVVGKCKAYKDAAINNKDSEDK